jgi:hypothetical protein
MAIETNDIASSAGIIWSTLLTIVVSVMGYFAKKRDDKLDSHDVAIDAQEKARSALELKIAENYATKPTVMALFQEATTQTKEAVARVEKSIDTTNITVSKVDTKIDGVTKSISDFQTVVMTELSKKT